MNLLVIAGALALPAAWGIHAANKAHAWDKMAMHSREIVRHLVSVGLLIGTTSGTIWTFSNGQLSLPGTWETFTSVTGVSAALEIGTILTGLYIGELTRRIKTARGNVREDLQRTLKTVYCWFGAVAAASAIANAIFRNHQLNNLPLAIFVSAVPVMLVVLFTIVLQPLPTDYKERARQSGERALFVASETAGAGVNRIIARMVAGQPVSDADIRIFRASLKITSMHMDTSTQVNLAEVAQVLGVDTVEGSATVYLTVADMMQRYNRSERWAQQKMTSIPGARQNVGRWEAPESAVVRILGAPQAQLFAIEAQ